MCIRVSLYWDVSETLVLFILLYLPVLVPYFMCLESVDHVLGVNWALLLSCTKKGNIWYLVYYTILILIFKLNRVSSLFSLPTFSSHYFTVTSKLNLIQVLESTAFFERPECITSEGRQRRSSWGAAAQVLGGRNYHQGSAFGCGDSSSAWARLPAESSSVCWAWSGSYLERAGSAQPGERNTGRQDGLCHPGLLTHIYSA